MDVPINGIMMALKTQMASTIAYSFDHHMVTLGIEPPLEEEPVAKAAIQSFIINPIKTTTTSMAS